MALIPAGRAVFGSSDDDPDAYHEEKPQFEVDLPDYYLGIYCVTSAVSSVCGGKGTPATG